MKKVILVSFLLWGTCNANTISVEKNDISIEYDICKKYSIPGVGKPYCMTIGNHSKKPIFLDSSLVTVPLQSNEEIIKRARNELKKVITLSGILSGILGYRSYTAFRTVKSARTVLHPQFPNLQNSINEILLGKKITLGGAIAFGVLSTYALYKLLLGTVVEPSKLLNQPFTLQPGKSVEKLFWIENIRDRDNVTINFDSIKVLK